MPLRSMRRMILASLEPTAAARRSALLLASSSPNCILSIHSILAGAALGTEDTLVGSVAIFLAIIGHKGAAAFALGVEFQRSGFDRSKYIRLLVTFASMTPL